MDRVILRDARLLGANFVNAELRGAKMSEAKLSGAVLENAKLGACPAETDSGTLEVDQSADLRNADLRGVRFAGAVLCGVVVSGADLRGAIDLRQVDLEVMVGDESTQIPHGLKRPKKWETK
jgi:uncharacterized protein YjbI with pentapeptide repeats